jgi:hypothetical protein
MKRLLTVAALAAATLVVTGCGDQIPPPNARVIEREILPELRKQLKDTAPGVGVKSVECVVQNEQHGRCFAHFDGTGDPTFTGAIDVTISADGSFLWEGV